MGMLAYQTHTGEPPIPLRVTDIAGQVLFTRGDILVGRGVFLS
jgi:nitric oxide reductase large subunit